MTYCRPELSHRPAQTKRHSGQ